MDAGLHMERAGNGTLDPKLRGSVFTIQTQSRTYHLEADCEAEMAKWVDAICRVCGLRPTEEGSKLKFLIYNKIATNLIYCVFPEAILPEAVHNFLKEVRIVCVCWR